MIAEALGFLKRSAEPKPILYFFLVTLLLQVSAERHAVANEYADTLRRLDAARTEMLQLKNRQVPGVSTSLLASLALCGQTVTLKCAHGVFWGKACA